MSEAEHSELLSQYSIPSECSDNLKAVLMKDVSASSSSASKLGALLAHSDKDSDSE